MTAAAPPAGADELSAGHRRLLATFRELLSELEEDPGADLETLRASVAFLRHSILPFSRAEEAALVGLPPEAEGAALDHAFLAAEIGGLAAEAGRPVPDARAVLRRLHRLEAVLELHLTRDEERGARALAPRPGRRPLTVATAVREMDDREIREFLRSQWWGVLSTVGPGGPYAVPVGFGFEGRAVHVAMGPGRKLRRLEQVGEACLTVAQVENGDRWCSVVVCGAAVPVEGLLERGLALRAIHRQRSGITPSANDLVRAARARVFRLETREVTGRIRA
jgi:nitroimidazol reductase NimA-like FMN-containing flavoprotein (pyridoxamine 5'-phosphate oxidase superfamily)